MHSCSSIYDMLVLQYFQTIPRRQLPNTEGPLSSSVQPATVRATKECVQLLKCLHCGHSTCLWYTYKNTLAGFILDQHTSAESAW